jgi:WD40 repeat protein
VTVDFDNVRAFDDTTGKQVFTREGDRFSTRFSPDGTLYSGHDIQQPYYMAPMPGGTPRVMVDPKVGALNQECVVFSHDDKARAAIGRNSIWILDSNGAIVRKFASFFQGFNLTDVDGAFTPDDKALVTWYAKKIRVQSFDGSVFLDMDESDLEQVVISPDGKTLALRYAAGTTDSTVKLRDLGTGATVGKVEAGSTVHCVAFSPDSKTLATGDESGRIILWDVATSTDRTPTP